MDKQGRKQVGKSIVYEKSLLFAKRIIKLYKFLTKHKREFVLSKQLLRSGTSIGANLKEAEFAQSDKDYISKMSIALKEAAETEYWLILISGDIVENQKLEQLIGDLREIIKMLVSILKSLKNKN